MGRWGKRGVLRGLVLGLVMVLLVPGAARAHDEQEPVLTEGNGHGKDDLEGEGTDTGKDPWVPLFELSLADTQFFAGNVLPDNPDQILPTSAALFLAEIFLTYRWRILTFFHLPLTPERTIVDGLLESHYSPPGIAAGLAFAPWWKDFKKKRRLELQIALVGGVFLRRKPRFFPMSALRLYLLHAEDMGLYIGLAYAFAPGTAGLIYGFGYRF